MVIVNFLKFIIYKIILDQRLTLIYAEKQIAGSIITVLFNKTRLYFCTINIF